MNEMKRGEERIAVSVVIVVVVVAVAVGSGSRNQLELGSFFPDQNKPARPEEKKKKKKEKAGQEQFSHSGEFFTRHLFVFGKEKQSKVR